MEYSGIRTAQSQRDTWLLSNAFVILVEKVKGMVVAGFRFYKSENKRGSLSLIREWLKQLSKVTSYQRST